MSTRKSTNMVIIWISSGFQYLPDINAQGRLSGDISHQNPNKVELKQTLPKEPNWGAYGKEANMAKRKQ